MNNITELLHDIEEEDFYKMSREDPLSTLKFSFAPYNDSACMFVGAKGGGDKGKLFFHKI